MLATQGAARIGAADGDPVPVVPEGQTLRDVMAQGIRDVQAARGVDLSDFDTDGLLTLSQYNLFPNATVLVWGEMVNVLIARPGPSVDEAQFCMYLFHRRPPGSPRTRITDVHLPADTSLGQVMDQDVALLRSAQKGLHQPGLDHLVVGSEEVRVINLHRNLERYLGIEPTELEPLE